MSQSGFSKLIWNVKNFEAGLNCCTVGLRSMRQQETKGGTGVGTSIMVIKIIFNYPPRGGE